MEKLVTKSILARFVTGGAIIAGLLLASHQQLASQSNAVSCEPINAQLDGTIIPCDESPVGFCAVGTVSNGPLKGSKEAVYLGGEFL